MVSIGFDAGENLAITASLDCSARQGRIGATCACTQGLGVPKKMAKRCEECFQDVSSIVFLSELPGFQVGFYLGVAIPEV